MAAKIPRIRKLVFLQNFDVFAVQNKRGYKIEELRDMTQLRGRLCVVNLENVFSQKKKKLEDVSSMEEAQRAEMKNK